MIGIDAIFLAAATLLGALVGGFGSYFAATTAIKSRFSEDRKVRADMAKRFFEFYFKEQNYHLNRLKDYRATDNDIWYLSLDTLLSNYSMFERNREHVISLEDVDLASSIFDRANEVQSWSLMVNQHCPRSHVHSDDAQKAEAKEHLASVFKLLPNIEQQLLKLRTELGAKNG